MVKLKVGVSNESIRGAETKAKIRLGWIAPAFALVTFLTSWADLYPTLAVDSRGSTL